MSYFTETRNIELSVIDYLTAQINASWTNINIVKSFTNAYKTALPVVCIRLRETVNDRREIGSDTLLNDYVITIDIFASSDGQRIDLSHFIMDKLKDGCPYYAFSQTTGSPETLTKAESGRIHLKSFRSNHRLDFGDSEEVDQYDRFRHFIEVEMRRSAV